MKNMVFVTWGLLILLFHNVVAFPFGPSSTSCETLSPSHPGSMQTVQSPYFIETSENTFYDNNNLTVRLRTNGSDEWYRGFLLQARCLSCANTTLPRGTFFLPDNIPAKVFKCYGLSGSVSHNSRIKKNETLVMWMPPPNFNHRVILMATVVKTTSVWWEQVTSPVLVRADDPTTPTTPSTTTPTTTPTPTTTTTPSTTTTTSTTISTTTRPSTTTTVTTTEAPSTQTTVITTTTTVTSMSISTPSTTTISKRILPKNRMAVPTSRNNNKNCSTKSGGAVLLCPYLIHILLLHAV